MTPSAETVPADLSTGRSGIYDSPMELFERADELATLRRELVLAREAGRVVTVSGDAGTGKTSLIRAALETDRDEVRVLRGLCDPLTTPRPLGPIRDALGQTPGLVRGHAAPDGLGTVEEQLLATVSASPTVLVVEDAQWIDAASVETLRYLVRRADALPALIVISYRHDAIGLGHPALALLGDIARSETSTAIRLEALSPAAVAQLLGEDGPDPARVHAITGGNPFFVAEIGRHPEEALPQTVRDVVLASTTRLEPDDLETLQLVATAPDGLDDRLLPTLGIDVPALRRMEQTGLLSRTRRGVVFRHELARLAIAETVSPEEGALLHTRLLLALETAGLDDAAVLAHHARAAGDPERTLRYALLAAEESRRTSSHTEAVAFLSLALTLVDDAAERAILLEQLSAEQYMISRLPDAIESIESALRLHEQLHDRLGTASAHDRRAIVEYYSARRHEAERHAELSAEAATGTEAFAASQTTRAYLAYRRHDVTAARRLGAQARVAVTADDHASQIRLDITEAAADLVEGQVSARERLMQHGLFAIDSSLDEVGTTAFSNLSALDIEQRRLPEAESVLERSIPLTVELDIPICRQWQTGQRARLHLMRGRWTAAHEDAEAIVADEGAPLALVWPHLVLAQLSLRRGGDASAAARHIDEGWRLALELDEALVVLAALAVIAERAWCTGEDDPRLDEAAQRIDDAATLPGTEWAVGDLLVWLDRLGVPAAAQPSTEPHRLELSGRHVEASAAWTRLGLPFDAALAGIHSSDPVVAASALTTLDELDVPGATARARALLQDRGLRIQPARPRQTTRANPSGLTNRQLDVARLLARGYTNRELAKTLYISPRTADHHVSAILAKLGLSNRRDVIRLAGELGLT